MIEGVQHRFAKNAKTNPMRLRSARQFQSSELYDSARQKLIEFVLERLASFCELFYTPQRRCVLRTWRAVNISPKAGVV